MVDDGLFSDTVDVSSVLSEDSGPSDVAVEGGRARAYISDRGVEVELDAGAEPVLVSAGASGKSAPTVVPLGTGYCVAWCEGEAEAGILKLRGLTADGAVFGSEMSIETGSFDHHSLAVSSFGSGDGSTAGVSVAWVADAGDGSGLGRIVLQRFSLGFDDDGTPAGLTPVPADHRSASELTTNASLGPWLDTANDNTVEIAALGREPVVNGLLSGDTLITWIGDDEHLHGALVAAPASDDAPDAVSSGHAGELAVINAALADLGPVAPAEAGQRRVKSLELGLGQIALMWLALGSSAIELRGVIVTLPDDSGGDAPGEASVTGLVPIALPPAFGGTFDVAGLGGDGDLAVTYGDAEGGATTVRVARLETDGPPAEPDGTGHEGSATGSHQFVSTSGAGTSARSVEIALDEAVESHSSGTGPGSPAPAASSSPAAQAGGRIEYFTVAGGEGDDGEDQAAPVVTATVEGFAAAWQVPSEDGQSTSVTLALFSSEAASASPASAPPAVYEVTDNADPGVAPAITGTGDGAAIAWVETGETESQLIIEVFEPEQGGTGSVVVDSGAGGYSGVSMTSQTVDSEAAAGYEEQVAVVWVENADNYGYGSVNLQRYGVPKHDDGSAPSQPVALGPDGTTDGSNEPAQLTSNDPPVVGRDPQAAGLGSGELAVIWVERDSSGKGSGGSIQGVIIKGEDKGDNTHLSLKSLMPFGVADDTKPIVFATEAGDISVAWLEPTGGDEDRGYDLKVATFAPDDSNGWAQPSTALSLYHFADEPDDFSLAVSGSDASTLVATWRGDGSQLYVQEFGLDGSDTTAAVEVTNSPQTDSDTSSAAVLGDGRVVVLYTDHQGSDVDVKAGVIDFSCPPDTSDPSAQSSGAGAAAPSGAETATTDAAVLPDFVGFADDAAAALVAGADASSEPGSTDPDWSGYTASSPGPVDDAGDGISAKTEGEPVILDPLANADGNGLHVTTVNGIPISPEAPVDVGAGFVQLREDGKLLFSPDLDFSGEAEFHFTLADDSGRTAQSEARIEVVAAEFSDALFGDDYGFNFDAWTKPEKQNDGLEAYFSESSLAASANEDSAFDSSGQHDYDLLVFKPGFGSDVISDFHGAPEEIIDISSFGYATFQALVEAGALMQVGDDVLITLTPSEPATSDKILLKSYDLSSLAADDFKFS